jgi:2-polyprenyl-6-methoxyphenol hydroxylase-like FAD-dependent oxidoreductase
MNTGIQDAVALAESLEHAIARNDDQILGIWARSRRKVATHVVALTDRLTRAATLESGVARGIRNTVFAVLGGLPPVRAAIARNLAELPAHDRRSA